MSATPEGSPSTSTATNTPITTYRIDPSHSVVEFAVKHMVFATVKGRFATLSGEIQLAEGDPTAASAAATVAATIEVASIDTRDPQRDAHLRSADFFDVENHPAITFRSRRVEPTGDGRARVVGDLTIRGVTREVVLETEFLGQGVDPWGNTRVGFSATTALNRHDFGLHWNVALEAGGFLVGDQIRIGLEVEAVRAG